MLLADVSGCWGSIQFWSHLQEQCLGLEEKLQNQRLGGHGGSCGCDHSLPASPTRRTPKAERVQRESAVPISCFGTCFQLLQVLLVSPSSATLLPEFGHPKTPLAGAASPREDGRRAGRREAVLPNRRCQAVVRGEPSASAQPACADTA